MRLKQLVLHNFGIYAGTVKIDFDNNKPIILIGGMNGHGKTTILEAILLALYGRRSFAFAESKMSFGEYLSKYINKSDGRNEVYLELRFLVDEMSTTPTEIDIVRSWSLKKTLSSIETVVSKNGKYDEYLSESWDSYVETILPCALSPLFFFDGEKIADLANTDDDEGIKKSIRSLLGIDVIDFALADIRKIVETKGKQVQANAQLRQIDKLEKEVAAEEAHVKMLLEKHGRLDVQYQQTVLKLQKAEDVFLASGGKVFLSRAGLMEKKVALETQLNEVTIELVEQLSGDGPLILVLPLLEQILVQAEKERDQKGMDIALKQLPRLYKEFGGTKEQLANFSEFISYVKDLNIGTERMYNLSENGYAQLRKLCATLSDPVRKEIERLSIRRREIMEEIVETDNYLSSNVDEGSVNRMYQEILQLTAKVAQIGEQCEAARAEIVDAQGTYEAKKKEHLRYIEKAVGFLENGEDIKRIVTYAGYATVILQEYKLRLQSEKTSVLAETMTNCFNAIAAKQHLICRIEIDPNSLSFTFYDINNKSISKSILSAGEKQLLIIAMLWALAICSKKEFPIIIDTPLARLDSLHREALICNYFPKASKQMVLLSTDSEVYGQYYSLLKPYIGHEVTLAFDEISSKSYVVNGYFGGER